MKIKEKVLKGMFTKEFLDSEHTPETELTMKGIESAIDLTLAEVDKVIGKCKVRSIVPMEERGMLEFDTGEGFISVEELKQKLGIK